MAHDPAAVGPALDLRHVDNNAELPASFAVMQALLHGRSVVVDDRVVTASARAARGRAPGASGAP